MLLPLTGKKLAFETFKNINEKQSKQQVSFFYELVENLLKKPEIRKLSQLPWSQKNNVLVRIP